MNYFETMGERDNSVPTTIEHLDRQMETMLADVLGEDPLLARGYLNTQVDPQTQEETAHSAWLACMASMNLLTPSQLEAAQRRIGFATYRAAVDPDGLRR